MPYQRTDRPTQEYKPVHVDVCTDRVTKSSLLPDHSSRILVFYYVILYQRTDRPTQEFKQVDERTDP